MAKSMGTGKKNDAGAPGGAVAVTRGAHRGDGAEANSAAGAIMAQAARLFADKGYDAASVREIAAAAGVAKPTVYYYYHSKEGLFEALLAASVSSFCRRLEEINARPPGYDARECLQDTVYAGFLFAREHKDFNRFIHGQVFSPMKRPGRQIIEKSFLQVTEAFRNVLRRAARARLMDEAAIEAAELSLRGTLLAHVIQHLQGHADLTPETARTIVDGFLRGYGKRPEGGRTERR